MYVCIIKDTQEGWRGCHLFTQSPCRKLETCVPIHTVDSMRMYMYLYSSYPTGEARKKFLVDLSPQNLSPLMCDNEQRGTYLDHMSYSDQTHSTHFHTHEQKTKKIGAVVQICSFYINCSRIRADIWATTCRHHVAFFFSPPTTHAPRGMYLICDPHQIYAHIDTGNPPRLGAQSHRKWLGQKWGRAQPNLFCNFEIKQNAPPPPQPCMYRYLCKGPVGTPVMGPNKQTTCLKEGQLIQLP